MRLTLVIVRITSARDANGFFAGRDCPVMRSGIACAEAEGDRVKVVSDRSLEPGSLVVGSRWRWSRNRCR